MQPLNGNILIETKNNEKNEGGLYVGGEKTATIMAVGEESKVKVGDEVIYDERKEKKIGKYVFINEDGIIAIL